MISCEMGEEMSKNPQKNISKTRSLSKSQQDLKAKSKKLVSSLRFSNYRERKQYLAALQIRQQELMLQLLELQILSSREELKDYHEARKLNNHIHKWHHKQECVE